VKRTSGRVVVGTTAGVVTGRIVAGRVVAGRVAFVGGTTAFVVAGTFAVGATTAVVFLTVAGSGVVGFTTASKVVHESSPKKKLRGTDWSSSELQRQREPCQDDSE
jgi:hypothetical protein